MSEENRQEHIFTNCVQCRQLLKVLTTFKCATCPKCGFHFELDAAQVMEGFKQLMKTVFGDAPEKPEHN